MNEVEKNNAQNDSGRDEETAERRSETEALTKRKILYQGFECRQPFVGKASKCDESAARHRVMAVSPSNQRIDFSERDTKGS